MPEASIKLGDVFTTNEGYQVMVVEYKGYYNVLVRFLDKFGFEKSTKANALRKGNIKNPYHPSVVDIGFMGHGKYRTKVSGKRVREYEIWRYMLRRCYCPKESVKKPTYSDVFVCEEWHNFQNFAEWYYRQPSAGLKGFDLDKDLRQPGSRVYSPETCSLVPHEINCLLHDNRSRRGAYPQGVIGYGNKYLCSVSIDGKRKHIGLYSTKEDAYTAYKKVKEDYVRGVAEKYKDVLHYQVYEKLKDWTLKNQ